MFSMKVGHVDVYNGVVIVYEPRSHQAATSRLLTSNEGTSDRRAAVLILWPESEVERMLRIVTHKSRKARKGLITGDVVQTKVQDLFICTL